MRKFLLKLALFVLPIFVFIYPVDYLISKYLSESAEYANGETKVWKDIYSGQVKSDLVIYGSSRAMVHFNPKILEDSLHISSYNLGINGNFFLMQYIRHQEFLKFNKIPKYIILSLDIFTLQEQINLFNYQQFSPFLLWNSEIKKHISSYNGFSMYDYYIPLVRYIYDSDALVAAIRSFLNYKSSSVRVKGYTGVEEEWNNDFEKVKSEADYLEIKIETSILKLLEQFIKECNRKGIKLILVFSPEHIEGQKFVKNRKEIISKYQYFANNYNLQFLDYSNDTICAQKQFFYNAEHLNKKGSELFTKKLTLDIKAGINNN